MRVLQESESVIRQLTRHEEYWWAADELAKMWFGTSFMPDPLVQRAVFNLTCAIDTLYESYAEEEGFDPDHVRSLGDELSTATEYPDKDAGPSRRDLLSATKALISAISHEGKVLLSNSNFPADAAERWWVLWRRVLQDHNLQQARSLQVLQSPHFPGEHAIEAFSEGVGAYLDDCAETIGVSPNIIGVLPFSTNLRPDQVSEMIRVLQDTDLLHALCVRLRLAYDLIFDPDEMINTGLAGYAAMTGIGVREARPRAAMHADIINANLRREWDRRSSPLIERIASTEEKYEKTVIGPLLSQFLRSSDQVAQRVVGASNAAGQTTAPGLRLDTAVRAAKGT